MKFNDFHNEALYCVIYVITIPICDRLKINENLVSNFDSTYRFIIRLHKILINR